MNIREYLRQNRMTVYEFSRKCLICPASVYKYLNGQTPQVRIAYKIERATKGEITLDDLLPKEEHV